MNDTLKERSRDGGFPWWGGLVIIIVGVVFLLRNYGVEIQGWWALFILIPAFANFARAWRSYREHGHLTAAARHSIIIGIIISLVASTFLFGVSWGLIWPIFIILIGIGIIWRGMR
jgi:hypothetical protein